MASTTGRTDSELAGPLTARAASIATIPTIRYFLVLIQLALLTILIRQFQIESAAFLRVALLAFAGFAIHHFISLELKRPFFTLLSIGGIVLVFGVGNGIALIGLGAALIVVCHLPIHFLARVAVLVVVGGFLAFLRTGDGALPWASAIWPILGAMFMFRLMVYLYDLRHDKTPVSFWETVSYFFLLPNVCFPLFPVVDFKTFRRTYFDRDPFEIYQVGINWMLRGITHLILYRIVYYYVVLAPSEVVTARDLTQYLISNFLLYLRVSGQFHLIIGMLHLFGFNLPETNYKYCLSSSFTDFWRRINIYWKDFMMKVFYYPAYFRLKHIGQTKAVVLATLFTFTVTWALHSYQWFWLKGAFPVTWQDVTFWTMLAGLVVATSLHEMKYGRKRSLGTARWTLGGFARQAAKILATFVTIVTLWSLWTASSFSSWQSMWSVSLSVDDLWLLVLLGIGVGVAAVVSYLRSIMTKSFEHFGSTGTVVTAVFLLPLTLVSLPQIYDRLGSQTASVVATLKSNKLSRLDIAALERGYYEDLMEVNQLNNPLGGVFAAQPAEWLDIRGADLVVPVEGFLQKELMPSTVATHDFGSTATNQWGMRDQEYERVPKSGTYRMVLLGASSDMGWGVSDGETYESIVESRLNTELGPERYARYEILNAAVPGYYPLQQAVAVEKALTFQPNAVLYVATGREFLRGAFYLANVTSLGIEVPYPGLRAIADDAGLWSGMSEDEAIRRLTRFRPRILAWLYRHIVETCRANGAIPVWVFNPQTYEGEWEQTTDAALETAQAAGFVVIDLRGVYDDHDIDEITLAEWDRHPNKLGHELLANALYSEIVSERDPLKIRDSEKRRFPDESFR